MTYANAVELMRSTTGVNRVIEVDEEDNDEDIVKKIKEM